MKVTVRTQKEVKKNWFLEPTNQKMSVLESKGEGKSTAAHAFVQGLKLTKSYPCFSSPSGPQGCTKDGMAPCLLLFDQDSSRLGSLLSSLFPLMEHFTLDNLLTNGHVLSSLVPQKHCSVLDVRNRGHIFGGLVLSSLLALESLEHVYIDELSYCDFPWAIQAAAHPSAIIHVKAFCVLTGQIFLDVAGVDVASLAYCLHKHERSFDWPGTLIV